MDVLAHLRVFDKSEAALSKTVIAELIGTLYGPLVSLVVASSAGAVAAIGVGWRTGSVPVDVLVGALMAVAVARVALAFAYRRSPHDDDLETLRRWESRYAIGAYAFSACLGTLCFVVFVWTDDPVSHLLVNAMAVGFTAGVTARNSNRLRIALPQLAFILLPITVGAAARFEPAYFLLSAITLLYFLATVEISRYLCGNYVRLLLTTEEKSELARSLNDQNYRFDAALNNMSHGLCMLDARQRLVVWNARFCELYGFPPAMVRVGETVRELVTRSVALGNHPDWSAADLEAMVSRYEGDLASRVSSQARIRLADDRILTISQRPISDGGAVVIFEDVTEQDRAENKSREQETLFRGLVENSMTGIFMIDVGGTVAYANPKFVEMVGSVLGEVIGRPILDFVAGADQQKVRTTMEAIFSGEKFTAQISATVRRKEGDAVDALGQGTLTTFQGKPNIVVMILDVTERRRADARIAELNGQMAAALSVLQRHLHDQTEVAQLSDLLQSCGTAAEAYPIIGASAELLFPQASGALTQVRPGTRELTRVATWGAEQTILPEFIVDDCWALRTGQRREITGLEAAAQCRHFSQAARGSYICLPLTVQGETRGSLHLMLGEGGAIDDDLRQTMQSFGDVVKLSLANISLRESLGHQAIRDQLTGLFNRRYLLETLPREVRRAKRSGSPLTVAMLDIDFFKRFNDMHGHEAGDLVLSELGQVLRENLRAEDISCRYGGEELFLVLPGCDLAAARARLTQIRRLLKGKAHVSRGQALPSVTLSVGLAALSETLSSAETLIGAADKAMYSAKTNGRDRIEDFLTPEAGGAELATLVPAASAETAQENLTAQREPG